VSRPRETEAEEVGRDPLRTASATLPSVLAANSATTILRTRPTIRGTSVAFPERMRSRAAIGNHPVHPALVPIPIGAFFMALVGDIAYSADSGTGFWYDLSFVCIGVGLVAALLAATAGAVDYFSVKMSGQAFRTATWHGLLNLLLVGLYAASFFLRRHGAAASGSRWVIAAALAFAGFALLAVTGWLGGKLAFEHRVGVIERLTIVQSPPRKSERAAS
jgi:uncharacterized membrane protein